MVLCQPVAEPAVGQRDVDRLTWPAPSAPPRLKPSLFSGSMTENSHRRPIVGARASALQRTNGAPPEPPRSSEFWGCPNFPRCKGTRPLEAILAVRPSDPGDAIEDAVSWTDPEWRRRSAAGGLARLKFDQRSASHRERVRERRPWIIVRGATIAGVGLFMTTISPAWNLAGWVSSSSPSCRP